MVAGNNLPSPLVLRKTGAEMRTDTMAATCGEITEEPPAAALWWAMGGSNPRPAD